MVYDGLKLWTLEFINMLLIQFETIWIQLYKLKLLELHENMFLVFELYLQVEGAAQCLQCTGGKGTIEQVGLDGSVVCFCLTSKHAEHSQVIN